MKNKDIETFKEDCGSGNLAGVSHFIQTYYIEPHSLKNTLKKIFLNKEENEVPNMIDKNKQLNAINFGLEVACANNQLEVLKILFSNKYTKDKIRVDFNRANYFSEACINNQHELLKFLLQDKSVTRKPSVNNLSPFGDADKYWNSSNVCTFGSATPLFKACENSSNESITVLLDSEKNNQTVQAPLLIKGLVCCLQKNNLVGANIIINNSNILDKVNNKDNEVNYFSNILALELGEAILKNKHDKIDFILNDCKLEYTDQLKDLDPSMHELTQIYLFREKLDNELISSPSVKRKSNKI